MRSLLILLMTISLVFVLGCEPAAKREAREAAEAWIKENAATFTERGGTSLEHIETVKTEEGLYKIAFDFESSFAGYGPVEEDEVAAQMITPHTIVVTVKDGEVVSVITDGKYDEIEEVLMAVIVNDKIITEEDLEEYMRQVARDKAEENLSREEIRELAIEKATETVLFNEYLDEKGIMVFEEEIEEEFLSRMDNYPGMETKEEYFFAMALYGFSQKEVETDITITIRTNKLFDLLEKDIEIPEEDVLQEYELYKSTRKIYFAFQIVEKNIREELSKAIIKEMIADELDKRRKSAEIKIME